MNAREPFSPRRGVGGAAPRQETRTMSPTTPRRLAAGVALLLLASVALVPSASAAADAEGTEAICPLLPLWDAGLCWAGVALNLANYAYGVVTCDVIGGPACGLDVCATTGICADQD